MSDVPLYCLDVGSRNGIEPDLLSAAFAIDAVGFEPASEECNRLNVSESGPWRSARFLPVALAAEAGTRTLHIAEDPISSSLLPPIQDTGERFNKMAYCTIVDSIPVETLSLDQAIDRFDLSAPDYLKLDAEGLELDILKGAEEALATVSVVKTEVGFLNFREGQPTARMVDHFLSERGFELMGLIAPAHWRHHGHVLHPHSGQAPLPYSRGQLGHGDFLYMRHPDALPSSEPGQRLKAAWLAMIYGYFDRAEEYFAHPSVTALLDERWQKDWGEALRLTSQYYGRIVWRQAFLQQIRGIFPFFRSARSVFARQS